MGRVMDAIMDGRHALAWNSLNFSNHSPLDFIIKKQAKQLPSIFPYFQFLSDYCSSVIFNLFMDFQCVT